MPILKTDKISKIVLDTHILLWLVSGAQKLTARLKKVILHAEAENGILLSPISIWEIGMLEAKGRIKLEKNCYDWIEEIMEQSGITLASITPKIAIDSSRLAGEFHGDPADRIIVATAIEHRAALITADEKIIAYAKTSSNLNVISR